MTERATPIEDLAVLAAEFQPASPGGRLSTVRASSLDAKRSEFLWDGRLPVGQLTIVCGIGGLGKSTATGALLARMVTRGEAGIDPASVLISSAEDDLEHTLVPRLIASGADLDLVEFISPKPDDEGHVRGLTLPEDLPALKELCVAGGHKLLVIDPMSSHLSTAVDSHRDASLRAALDPLAAMARETGVTVVVVAHLNKSNAGEVYVRLSGSAGAFNAARSVLLFARDPDGDPDQDDGRRVFVHAKCNVGVKVATLQLQVESANVTNDEGEVISTSRLKVTGETWMSEADALAPPDRNRTTTDEASDWLLASLADGKWHRVSELKAAAKRDFPGTHFKTIERAGKPLGVQKEKAGMDGGWRWRLPPGDLLATLTS